MNSFSFKIDCLDVDEINAVKGGGVKQPQLLRQQLLRMMVILQFLQCITFGALIFSPYKVHNI